MAATDGIFTHAEIEELLRSGAVRAEGAIAEDQVQPTSLDLRLGRRAVRIRAGFLPARESVAERLAELALFEVDLERGAVFEPGQIYLVPLAEELRLPAAVRGRCNPKSSTGRVDLFTRVIVDRHDRFDQVPAGYQGPLWLEVMPRSFPVRATAGQRLNQVRFYRGQPQLSDEEHLIEHARERLIALEDGRAPPGNEVVVERGFYLRVGLKPAAGSSIAGYRARRYTGVVDLGAVASHDPLAFFEPVAAEPSGRLLLEPEEFYIFASKERIRVPPHLAAEMVAYDVGIGELRTNYAGFFDAGFGWGERGERHGTPAVLEVRPHDVPFLIEDGQVFFKLEFSRTAQPCRRLYGEGGAGSHYADQGLTLAKYFRR